MQKPKGAFRRLRQCRPVRARSFQQVEGAHHIGLDEFAGGMDRAVYMAFGGKMHYRLRLVFVEQACDQRAIADIALREHMPRILG